MSTRRAALAAALLAAASGWPVVDVRNLGAVGDNSTDNTAAFRAAAAAVAKAGGGEILVPAGGVFRTAPFNLSSNVALRVEGTVRAVENRSAFPVVAVLPSYGSDLDTRSQRRRHPFVWAPNATNVTISGAGTIDGAGAFWWPDFFNKTLDPGVGRPHLIEINNVTRVRISGVTLLNSAFWTLHPVYCTDVHIHGIKLLSPWCQNYKCANTDGIDVDSTKDVVIENNYISCGDDHVTIIAGAGAPGRAFAMPSKNVTVRNNILGTGMGMSIGSSVSGGVEDVTYSDNVMTETEGEWGQGAHIKTRVQFGGHISNIAFVNNVFKVAGSPGGALVIETSYQSGGQCNVTTCTRISDIVFRNLTVVKGGLGGFDCYPARPCTNLTFEDISVNTTAKWQCKNVASGVVRNVSPPGLAEACGIADAS